MDQSCGRRWTFRRIVTFALAGAGACVALASGGTMVDTARIHPAAERTATPADLASSDSLPVNTPVSALRRAPVGQAIGTVRETGRGLGAGGATSIVRRAGSATTVVPANGTAGDATSAAGLPTTTRRATGVSDPAIIPVLDVSDLAGAAAVPAGARMITGALAP
ncbi:MAG TPA: hypothetical protein VGO86_18260 [Candidatus Dormibacteraeota bacterium]